VASEGEKGSDHRGLGAVKGPVALIGFLDPRRTGDDYGVKSRYFLGTTLRHSQKLLARPAL
jgi:hypothetical protein